MREIAFVLFILMSSCQGSTSGSTSQSSITSKIEPLRIVELDGRAVPVFNFEGVKPYLTREDTGIHVVNFWATWCAPCVEELPYFEQLLQNYREKNLDLTLVSLDFPNQYQSRLLPFVLDNKLQGEVIILDDVKQNDWVPQVHEDWSGVIPATLIYKKDKKVFFERPFENYKELETELLKFLQL